MNHFSDLFIPLFANVVYYKVGQTEFNVYRHHPHGSSQKFSDFIFNTVNIQHFEPHPPSVLIRGRSHPLITVLDTMGGTQNVLYPKFLRKSENPHAGSDDTVNSV